MLQTILTNIFLIGFLLIEVLLRKEGEAKSLETGDSDKGPYRVIRHPGYLSSILVWVGSGLSVENWILIIIFTCLFFIVYIYRIKAEEKMLVLEFGEQYLNYRRKTWRLIPFLY